MRTARTKFERVEKAVEQLKTEEGAAPKARDPAVEVKDDKWAAHRKVGTRHSEYLKTRLNIQLTVGRTPMTFRELALWHVMPTVKTTCRLWSLAQKKLVVPEENNHELLQLLSWTERILEPLNVSATCHAADAYQKQLYRVSEVVTVYKVPEAAAAVVLLLHQRGMLNELQDCTFEGALTKLLNERFVNNDAHNVIGIYHYLDALVAKPVEEPQLETDAASNALSPVEKVDSSWAEFKRVGSMHKQISGVAAAVDWEQFVPMGICKPSDWGCSSDENGGLFKLLQANLVIHKHHRADKERVESSMYDLEALASFVEQKLKGSELVPNYKVSEAAAAMLLLLHQTRMLDDFEDYTFEGAKDKLLKEHFVDNDAHTVIGIFHYLDALVAGSYIHARA